VPAGNETAVAATAVLQQRKVAVPVRSLRPSFGSSSKGVKTAWKPVTVAAVTLAASTALVLPGAWATTATALTRAPVAVLPTAPQNLSLAWAIPNYPVGRQLRWLLRAATGPPVPASALKAHFDAQFLSQVPPTLLNQGLEALHLQAPVGVTSLDAGLTASALEVGLASGDEQLGLVLSVDEHGLINGLRVAPAPALPNAPESWAGLDAQLRSLAPDVSFEAATLGPPVLARTARTCQVLNSLAPTTARPLGSMFKLYVLATVASEVRTGHLSWGQEVPLTAGLRSVPSGFLQIQPAGSRYSVSQLAQIMVSGSDNTAADRLAALAGRSAVEAQVATTSTHSALDEPFLRTRELAVLKYADYPTHARAYLRVAVAKRAAYLDDVVDQVPLSDVDLTAAATAGPRDIGSIEWFASPSDICAVYAQLYADASSASLAQVSTALSYNDGGIGLSRSAWPLVWFKGGSESGVLSLGYLGRRADGTVAVVVLELSDPAKGIAADLTPKALADLTAAFDLVPRT